MTDLTPLFRQCVDIVQQEYKTQPTTAKQPYYLNDTFIKETTAFFHVLTNLNQFINETKSSYLAINDDTKLAGSIDDKNKIDEEFNYKVQQMYKRLNHLETYETKRQSLLPKTSGWFSFLDESNDQDIYFETLANHRMQILRFLMETLNHVNKRFENIQQKRLARERQLNLLTFQNFEDGEELEDVFPTLDQIQQVPELSQQQIQQLETENQEFLNMKTSQLKQVEKVQQSILDIVNIQNELAFKLQDQGQQIESLMDSHADVQTEVQMGNRTLSQATKKNKRGANMLVMLCIVLGVLLVLVDYVSFWKINNRTCANSCTLSSYNDSA